MNSHIKITFLPIWSLFISIMSFTTYVNMTHIVAMWYYQIVINWKQTYLIIISNSGATIPSITYFFIFLPILYCCCCSHGLQPKKALNYVAVSPATVRVPSQKPLATSVTSVTSVCWWQGDNEMVPATMNRSPGIYLTAEENPGKSQLGDRR